MLSAVSQSRIGAGIVRNVTLPVVLIVLAALAGAVVAYGTDAGWGSIHHGLDLIIWSRRLQWPLVTLSLLLCVTLIALVIGGKKRAWWLIGLGPILALFVHRFASDRGRPPAVADEPTWVAAADRPSPDPALPADDDWVVGLTFNDVAYAYPFASLFRTPVVVQSDREKRLVLLWSAYANRALAFQASNGLRARDLEVVSSPANALLVYHSRTGRFINGVTGQTTDGKTPELFRAVIPTVKTTWKRWRLSHPATKVMPQPAAVPNAPFRPPTQPIMPVYRMPDEAPSEYVSDDASRSATGPSAPPITDIRVTLIGSAQPAAVPSAEIGVAPANLAADGGPCVVVRANPLDYPQAFDARSVQATFPRFVSLGREGTKHPEALLREMETGTLWSARALRLPGGGAGALCRCRSMKESIGVWLGIGSKAWS